jgi:dihydropteroate synthase
MQRPFFHIQCTNTQLTLGTNTQIMGILNTTPDSFSDGGKYLDPFLALDRANEMIAQGANIIDIGGESTRPKGPYGEGAVDISQDEEIRRTIPIIKKLAPKVTTPISIDTTKSEVAKHAIEAGASIVNDISALRFDPQMATIVAKYQVPVVLMHMKGTPKTMQQNPEYDQVIAEMISFLDTQIHKAIQAGIHKKNILIDPGFGFGKRFKHNIEILANIKEFHTLQCPILVGPSRKQFTGPQVSPTDRLPGTLAALTKCILSGAHIVRVHDVWQAHQAAQLADHILNHPPC